MSAIEQNVLTWRKSERSLALNLCRGDDILHSDKNKHDEKLKLCSIFYLLLFFYFILFYLFIYLFFCEVVPVIQQRLAWTVSNVLLKDF